MLISNGKEGTGAPGVGGLSWFSVWLLVSAQGMILGSRDRAPGQALCSMGSLLANSPSLCLFSLSKINLKILKEKNKKAGTHHQWRIFKTSC